MIRMFEITFTFPESKHTHRVADQVRRLLADKSVCRSLECAIHGVLARELDKKSIPSNRVYIEMLDK